MVDVGMSAVGVFTEVKDRQLKPFNLKDSSGQPISGVFPLNSRPVLGGGGFRVNARHPWSLIPGLFSIAPGVDYGMAWAPNYSTQFWSATANPSLHLLDDKARVTAILGYGGYTVEGSATAQETRHGFNGGVELAIRVARRLDLATRVTTTLTGDGPQTIVGLGLNWFFSDLPAPTPEKLVRPSQLVKDCVAAAPAARVEPPVSANVMEAQRAIVEAERLLSEAELPTTPWFRGFIEDMSKYGWGQRSYYSEQRALFDCLMWIKGPQEWKAVRLRPLSHILRDLDANIRRVETAGDMTLKARVAQLRERAGKVGVVDARAIAAIFAEQKGELRWREIGGLIRNALVKLKPGDTAQQDVVARHIQDFDEILALVIDNVSLLIPLVSMEERITLHRLNAALQCLRFGGADCPKEDEVFSVSGLKAALATVMRLKRSAISK